MPRPPKSPTRRKATYAVLSPLRLPISPPRPRPNLSAYPPTRRRLGLDGGFGALLLPPVHQNALAAAGAEPLHTNATSAEHDPDGLVEGSDERAASPVQQT